MQRFNGLLVFSSLANTRLWKCQTRQLRMRVNRKSRKPMQKTVPFFEVSNLLFDLNDEDAKGVRQFEEGLDGVPKPRLSPIWRNSKAFTQSVTKSEMGYHANKSEPLAANILDELDMLDPHVTSKRPDSQHVEQLVAEFEMSYQANDSTFKSLAANSFHPWHISDFDLLMTTLLSSNDNHTTIDVRALRAVLDNNGIPTTVRGNHSNTMAYMLRRRSLSSNLHLGHGDEALFLKTLGECQSFLELERIITRMTKSFHGCRMLSESGGELGTALLQAQDVQPLQVLALLNNLFMNLDRFNLQISSNIHELGIWVSLGCHAFITTQQYLKRWFEYGNHEFNETFVDSILAELSQRYISPSQDYICIDPDPSNRLMAVFSLLTGYIPGEDKPAFSLRSLVRRDRKDTFRLYIQCLARLGAFRTIWYEWHEHDVGFPGDDVLPLENKPWLARTILDVVATNSSIKNIAELPFFSHAAKDFLRDCQYDLVAISDSAESLALPGAKTEIPNAAFAQDALELYDIMSKNNLKSALTALQPFLLRKNSFL
ncbi:hypothetical protein GGS21DRAFT_177491 [Xylaria nigripes]|nr:hypothetical protein GGS21DRAFT_177491 [Xylaria nigripes]